MPVGSCARCMGFLAMTDRGWVPKVGEEVIVVDTWRDTVEAVASRDGVTWVALADGDVHDLSAIRPGDESSVDDFVAALDRAMAMMPVGWVPTERRVEFVHALAGHLVSQAAIRAAFEAVTKETP